VVERLIATLTPQLASTSPLGPVDDPLGGRPRAPIPRRLIGAGIDGIVVGLLLRMIGAAGLRGGVAFLVAIAATIAYVTVATRVGGTLGNLATRTVVVSQSTGRSVGWGRALARAVAVAWLVLSVIGLLVDLAYPTFDVRRQMLHDLAGRSQVVLRRSGHRVA
jgi:RDD family